MAVYLGSEMVSAYAGGIATKPEEEKIVTAGTSPIEIIPSEGKSISKVTINPTPTEEKTVTPSTSQQIISSSEGKHISQVTVEAVDEGSLSDITVSSSGLITAQVGISGYLETGTTKTKQLTTQGTKTVTPSTSAQTAVASGRYTTGEITVAKIPDNFVDLKAIFGCSKMKIDTFYPESHSTLANTTISHSLGSQPGIFMIASDSRYWSEGADDYDVTCILGIMSGSTMCLIDTYVGVSYNVTSGITVTSSSITIPNSSAYFAIDEKYTVITMV